MNCARNGSEGGFHFGDVNGGVSFSAGGDIVGTTKSTTIIQNGFAADEQKRQFGQQIDELRAALRQIKAEIEANALLSDDQKEEATCEILQHIKALKEVKEKTEDVPTGKQAPADLVAIVESTLKRSDYMIDMLQGLATKAVGITDAVVGFVHKYGPLVLSTRHLFGLL